MLYHNGVTQILKQHQKYSFSFFLCNNYYIVKKVLSEKESYPISLARFGFGHCFLNTNASNRIFSFSTKAAQPSIDHEKEFSCFLRIWRQSTVADFERRMLKTGSEEASEQSKLALTERNMHAKIFLKVALKC